MRKVTKIFLSVVSTLILAAIILPIFFALLLYLPPVQNVVVKRATKAASKYLGTTVSIKKINLKPFSRLTVDGFYVEDYNQDTLLYADNLDVRVLSLGLPRGVLSLGRIKLSDTRFNLVENEEGITNLEELIEKIAFERDVEKRAPLRLRSTGVHVDNMHFSLRRGEAVGEAYGVDFNDIDLQSINLEAKHINIRDDSLSMSLKDISFMEKSGFEMTNISANEVVVSANELYLGELSVATPNSSLYFDLLNLRRQKVDDSTTLWQPYVDVIMTNSSLSTTTLAYFVPALSGIDEALYNVNATFSGSPSRVEGRFNRVEIGDSKETMLSFSFSATELMEPTKSYFVVDVDRFVSNSDDVRRLYSQIAGAQEEKKNGKSKKAQLSLWQDHKRDNINMVGHFEGGLGDFRADAKMKMNGGHVDFDLRFAPTQGGMTHFEGFVDVGEIKLTELLQSNKFGRVSLAASLDGSFGKGNFSANADGTLAKMEYNDYAYHDIKMVGAFDNMQFRGKILSSDPNLDFNFDGMLDFNDSIPRYDFDLDLYNVDLHKLNFNTRDSISLLKARVDATGSGSSFDNINGELVVSNMLYVNHIDSVTTGEVRVVGQNSETSKAITFRSSFADMDYRSRTSYSQVINDLRRVLHYYVPTLSERDIVDVGERPTTISEVDNFSLFNVNIKEANNVASIFVPGFMIASGSRLSFMFNPEVDRLSLTANSDYVEFGDNFVSKLEVNSQNQGDSISLFIRADELLAKSIYLPNFSVIGALKDNQLNTTMRVLNPDSDISALVGLHTMFSINPETEEPQIFMRFTPSNIRSGKQEWDIFSQGIILSKERVEVDNFVISGTNQEFRVDGVAGKTEADTLNISLSRFDLIPISSFTSREGYNIEGMATGKAQVVSAMKDGFLSARVNFNDVGINKVKVPDGYFVSTWDMEKQRARFALSTLNTKDTLIVGYYLPSEGEYVGDVKLSNVDLSLLHPLLDDEMKDIQGSADFDVQLTGNRNGRSLNGWADIRKITLDVDFIHVPFTVKDVRLNVTDNVLWLKSQRFYDALGNSGLFDVEVDLNNLKNVAFDISMRPQNMLLYNTTRRESPSFYGRVFASGHARIRGDKSRTDIDLTATTTGDSEFYLPLAGEETMGVSNIITFLPPERIKVDSTDYAIRRQIMLENRFRDRQKVKEENLHVKLALNVTPDVDFQLLIDPAVGDAIRGMGEGSISLNINPQNDIFAMYGDYEILRGTYQFTIQNIISKRFAIEAGSRIIWTGEPADPILDVTGVYKLKASLNPILGSSELYRRTVPVECRILLSDRVSMPTVNFDIDVSATPEVKTLVSNELSTQENMATQFFFLVAANSFYPTAYTGNIGTAAGSSAMFDILANQVSNIISNDKFNIGFRYKPRDELTSEEFNVDFSTQLFGDRVLLELEGNYDVGSVPNFNSEKVSNLTGDFAITWLIDEEGNLRAKGFTRTIDRFDENQGQQESGIGLYYKEDFDTFKDIGKNFRRRFSRKQRREEEARALEEAIEQEEREAESESKEREGVDGGESGESGEDGDERHNSEATEQEELEVGEE